MTKRQTPPGRKSKACVVVVKPLVTTIAPDVPGRSIRGASSTREPTIERGSCSRSILFLSATTFLPFLLFLFALQHLQIAVETIEALFPKPTIFLQPLVGFLESAHINPAGTHLCIPSARDEAGAL